MTEKTFVRVMVLIIIFTVVGFGLKFWSKNELCATYYADMNRLACFMSDSMLPQRARSE